MSAAQRFLLGYHILRGEMSFVGPRPLIEDRDEDGHRRRPR
jgi:lipopolysaccharide/colanic/teichoic acid biosynthesis glycosyltransferase